MKLAPTLGFGAALLGAGIAFAQPATPPANAPRADRGARMFDLIDANRDGRITWDESWSFVTTRFGQANTDSSGGLTVQEFAALRVRPADAPVPSPERAGRMEEMRGTMFRSLDANRDGLVTLEEIRPFVEARFRGADANGDGAVTRDEVPQRGRHGGGNPPSR